MSQQQRIVLPVAFGVGGALLLTAIYFGLVSWAESPKHAAEFFWQDRWIVLPIILGFGVQSALYIILKKRLFVPANSPGSTAAMRPAIAPGAHLRRTAHLPSRRTPS